MKISHTYFYNNSISEELMFKAFECLIVVAPETAEVSDILDTAPVSIA
jgi:hypothetical protein